MTEAIGLDETVATGAVQAPVHDADEFAHLFGIGSNPTEGDAPFVFTYVPAPSRVAPEEAAAAAQPQTEPSRIRSSFSRFRERGTRFGQRIESGIHNTLTSITESTRSALSSGQAELIAARARIVEAMTPRSRKVERAQQAATIVLEQPILSVPPVYDGGAADKREHLSTWITPTQVQPEAHDLTSDGEVITHYHYNENGRVVVQEMIDAVRADAVRTQDEFGVASEALKKAYFETKKAIEATIADSTSPSERARAAAQIELARRITSTARLRAYNSLRSAERERRLAQPAAPISQDILDNRARADAILSRIYTDLNIDRLPYTPDATSKSALWREVSDRIRAQYERATVLTLAAIELDENKDLATINFYRELIEGRARRACATARLIAWNQMTRPEPVVPAEAVDLVESVEGVDAIEGEDPAETAHVIEALAADVPGLEPLIESLPEDEREGVVSRICRLPRWKMLTLIGGAAAVGGIAILGAQVYGNMNRYTAAKAQEAALAAQQTYDQDVVFASEADEVATVTTEPATATVVPAQSRFAAQTFRPFSGFRPVIGVSTKPAPAVQTLEAEAGARQHDADATETAEPEHGPRIDYTSGKPVRMTVQCGDRVIPFTMAGEDGSMQDVVFSFFDSMNDVPDGYNLPADRALRIIHRGLPVSGFHSELYGREAHAGEFQNFVLWNGGPSAITGCTVTAEQEGVQEASTITQALLVPSRQPDGRDTNVDDMLDAVEKSRQKSQAETGEELPPIDGIGYTCYSFAQSAQGPYVQGETTQYLVWATGAIQ